MMSINTEVSSTNTKISQIDLIGVVLESLAKMGVTKTEPRILNAVVDGVNSIIREIERIGVMASDGMGAERWLRCDDTGLSSKFMCYVLTGYGTPPRRVDYPHDPDDFGRCYRFLRAIDMSTAGRQILGGIDWRRDLSPLKSHGNVWSAYVDAWPEMTSLYEEELPSGNFSKLDALMQRLQAAAARKE